MGTFFDTNQKKDCNGCGVCALKCPKKAITMVEDGEGFYYPVIDKNKCVNCGLCKKICPNHEYVLNNNVKTYMVINKNKDDLFRSSSGGAFYAIAKAVIQKNGIVFGVQFNNELKAEHNFATNLEELKKFQGSKYVRSNLGDSYKKVKDFLNDGKLVLFTGTPCQCQGLRSYIGKNDLLITCDIICHSNPSPKVLELYKKNIEKKYNKTIVNILFRTKQIGWHCPDSIIVFDDGCQIIESSFYHAFLTELLNRESCHNCHFCTINRLSDFTIGDLWGVTKIDPTITDDNTGISLLCVNTDKGEEIFNILKNQFAVKAVKKEDAIKYNHNSNLLIHEKRKKFYKGIANGTINESNIIESLNKYSKRNIVQKIFRKIRKKLHK